MTEARFTLPSLPPSINSAYSVLPSRGPGGRIHTEIRTKPAVRQWKTQAKEAMEVDGFKLHTTSLVWISITFHYPFKHGNGRLRRKDSHNYVKLVCDVVAERLGFDDSRIKAGTWASVDDEGERVEVMVREVE